MTAGDEELPTTTPYFIIRYVDTSCHMMGGGGLLEKICLIASVRKGKGETLSRDVERKRSEK